MTSVKSNCLPSKKTRRIGVDAARWSRQPMGEATAEGRLDKLFARRGMTYTTALRRFFGLRRWRNPMMMADGNRRRMLYNIFHKN